MSANAAMLAGEEDAALNLPTKRGRPEAAIQRAIRARLAFHGIVCVAVPNEGRRSVANGRMMKATGLLPGFPDLILLAPGGRVAFLEVKAPAGRVSSAQSEAHAMLERLGHHVAVVRSQDEAVDVLRGWGLLTQTNHNNGGATCR